MKVRTVVILLVLICFSQIVYSASPKITLTITDVSSFLGDHTNVYFGAGTSTAFVPIQDNAKVFNVDTTYPQLYSLSSDNVDCFSNGYGDFIACTEVPLGFRVEGGSSYRIETTGIENFDSACIIQLEDKLLGIFHKLLDGPYIFQQALFQHSANRFVLHISYPPSITSVAAGCNNDDGVISVYQEPCINWDVCFVQNSAGQIVQTYTNINGSFSFSGLPEGSYLVIFQHGSYTTDKSVTLDGHQILSSINVPTTNGFTGEPIIFSAVANNADDYSWTFGDSSEISGVANPDYTYYEPGTYTVTVISTNIYGCSDTATITVVINQGTSVPEMNATDLRIFTQSKKLNIFFLAAMDVSCAVEVYNLEGKQLLTTALSASSTSIDLHHLSSGMYVVAVTAGENIFFRRIILTQYDTFVYSQ